jgi:hypothetical protein
VSNPKRERPTLSRGNADICPMCGDSTPTKLRQTNPASTLDWFRCEKCDHMWAVQHDSLWSADEGNLRLIARPDRRQTPDRRKYPRRDRRR